MRSPLPLPRPLSNLALRRRRKRCLFTKESYSGTRSWTGLSCAYSGYLPPLLLEGGACHYLGALLGESTPLSFNIFSPSLHILVTILHASSVPQLPALLLGFLRTASGLSIIVCMRHYGGAEFAQWWW